MLKRCTMKKKKTGKVGGQCQGWGWHCGFKQSGPESAHGEGDVWVHGRAGGGMNSVGVWRESTCQCPELGAWRWEEEARTPEWMEGAVIQWLSLVWRFATPWTEACQASLFFTVSRRLLKLMFIELMLPCEGRKNHMWLHFHEDFYCELGSQKMTWPCTVRGSFFCVGGQLLSPPHSCLCGCARAL